MRPLRRGQLCFLNQSLGPLTQYEEVRYIELLFPGANICRAMVEGGYAFAIPLSFLIPLPRTPGAFFPPELTHCSWQLVELTCGWNPNAKA